MRKFNIDERMIMIEAVSDAGAAIDIAKSFDWRPHDERLRMCSDKYAEDCAATGRELPLAYQVGGLAPDDTEDEIVIPPINKSRSRKQRRRAEELRKEYYEIIWNKPSNNDGIKKVAHGEKTAYIKSGSGDPWKKVWRRMNHRALREDGKRQCREWDVTDFVSTSSDEEVTVVIPETFNNLYVVTYDWDNVLINEVIYGYDKAVEHYNRVIELDDVDDVALCTCRIKIDGRLVPDKCIMNDRED